MCKAAGFNTREPTGSLETQTWGNTTGVRGKASQVQEKTYLSVFAQGTLVLPLCLAR